MRSRQSRASSATNHGSALAASGCLGRMRSRSRCSRCRAASASGMSLRAVNQAPYTSVWPTGGEVRVPRPRAAYVRHRSRRLSENR